jgi:chemotaxis protein MotB
MKNTVLISLALLSLLTVSSCVTSKKYKSLESRYTKLLDGYDNQLVTIKEQTKKLTDFQNEINRLNREADSLNTQNAALTRQYNDVKSLQKNLANSSNKETAELLKRIQRSEESLQKKEDELREKNKKYAELQQAMDNQAKALAALKMKVADALVGFEGKGLSVVQKNGKVYVSVEEKLLFKPGKWDIEQSGREALKKVSDMLEQNPDINIMVEGHTDNLRYVGTNILSGNWDLSVKRATTVVKTLLEDTSIDPARITAAGRSEYAPIESNSTASGRQKNRRTEIILTPKIDELIDLLKN